METKFEALQSKCEPPTPRARPKNSWISSDTWKLVDTRAMHRKRNTLPKQHARDLGRQIVASLKEDRRQRAADAASKVESLLAAGDVKEGWRTIKGWYRDAEDRAPKPCYTAMAEQMREREELYVEVPSPGESIPINVDPFPVNDDTPLESEIRGVARGLRNGRAGGASQMTAEHVKEWLQGMVQEEKEGTEGAGNNWNIFIRLIQAIWEQGEIPQQMLGMIVMLLPKGGGDYRGIGLL